jgi:hypothetical protein
MTLEAMQLNMLIGGIIKMEKMYLIKFDDNWCDEMDIDGHCVITEKTYLSLQEATKYNPEFTFYIGSNEEIEYGGDYINSKDVYEATEITHEQLKVLKELGLVERGYAFRFVNSALRSLDEDEDENEDEEQSDGFYIENPIDFFENYIGFDLFEDAIEHCEKFYGYKGYAWKEVKESDFKNLHDFLAENGIDSYLVKDGEEVEFDFSEEV